MDCLLSKNKNSKDKKKEPPKQSQFKAKDMMIVPLLLTNQLEKLNYTFKVAQIMYKAQHSKTQTNKSNSYAKNIMNR